MKFRRYALHVVCVCEVIETKFQRRVQRQDVRTSGDVVFDPETVGQMGLQQFDDYEPSFQT